MDGVFRQGLAILALGLIFVAVAGCEYLPESSSVTDGATNFPGAGIVVNRAKSIDMASDDNLGRMYGVKESAIETKYDRLIDSAPDNQKGKYELEKKHALEELELAYQERRRQLLAYE